MPLFASLRELLGRFEDRSGWPPVRRDWLVVAGWALAGGLDILWENENGVSFTNPDPTPPLTWAVFAPFVALLLWRRRSPLLALALGYVVIVVGAAIGGHLEKGFVPVAQLGFFAYCAARAAPGRRELVAVGVVGLVGILGALFSFTGSPRPADFFWATVMLTLLPMAAARAFRQHERLHDLLAERAAQVETQRDERARLATAQERERIAGELHDVVAHGVSAMVVQAQAARRLVAAGGDTDQAHTAIADLEASGRAALDELRRLLGVLRRGDEGIALAPQPSLARVDRLVARLRDEGLPVDLAVEGDAAPLPPGLDVTAYRIVEEALTDVLRGTPDAARVRVRYGTRELELEVSDDGDGRGHDAVVQADSGFGLRERVALFGGELHAGRRRGGGWSLQARLPLEREPVT